MTLAPISPVSPAFSIAAPASPSPVVSTAFGRAIVDETKALNAQLLQADKTLEAVASGAPISMHRAMIQIEETQLAFQTLVQFRNKILEAYQEIMRVQV